MNAVIKIFLFICNLIVIPINMSKAATFSEVIAPITKNNKALMRTVLLIWSTFHLNTGVCLKVQKSSNIKGECL